MPVPRVTTSKRSHSRPAPKWCSPNAHATASLSMTTGAPSSAASNPAKSKPENQGSVSGLEMVPLGNNTGPLAPIPTPSSRYPSGNSPVTTAATLDTRSAGAPAPSSPVGTSEVATTLPSEIMANRVPVPPMSMPT